MAVFYPDIVWLAAQAGWTVGLVVGLVLLVANNPERSTRLHGAARKGQRHGERRPQLPYAQLRRLVLPPLLLSIAGMCIGGSLGPVYLRPLVSGALLTPHGTSIVWGMHLGSYGGAAIGLIFSVCLLRRRSRGLAYESVSTCPSRNTFSSVLSGSNSSG